MRGQITTGADGSVLYVTIEGDMVDQIAHYYYGKHGRHTEELYSANPDVVAMPPVLPAGIVVRFPAAQIQEPSKPFRKLWD
ncbi:tail protein X [Agrobacterium tumefaciens]|uniref:tail protein X n=1 Tax=Agrobacterium tumefaciens TaxID=358 RepID=UPI001572768B|nr:tail protein X [Agrobacterium tumefaciens]NTD85506.1 phage tail protein [Agrobacterium tumefaciens]NTD90855.1 phage tail protein [Agrobacterium tumefaciens]NTE03677.1 phage tail protein [Agrobacterium tumefaciens]NTE15929.1 phage tail protein [Agrobacterium tumefaciens]NTE26503.1 phage tail protein [Agrobacterium tumefaciens]